MRPGGVVDGVGHRRGFCPALSGAPAVAPDTYETSMQTRMVRLTVTPPHFVACEADADRAPASRSLVIPGGVFQKAVAWAETRGFRAPRRHFLASQTATFARCLREAIAAPEPAAAGVRWSARMTPTSQVRDFFAIPGNMKFLNRLLVLVDAGGAIDVTDA